MDDTAADVAPLELIVEVGDGSRAEVLRRAQGLLDEREQQAFHEASGRLLRMDEIEGLRMLAEQRRAVSVWARDEAAYERAVARARQWHRRQQAERERRMAQDDPHKTAAQIWREAWVSATALTDIPDDPQRPWLAEGKRVGEQVCTFMRRRGQSDRPLTAKETEVLLGPVRLARQFLTRDGKPFDPIAEAARLHEPA